MCNLTGNEKSCRRGLGFRPPPESSKRKIVHGICLHIAFIIHSFLKPTDALQYFVIVNLRQSLLLGETLRSYNFSQINILKSRQVVTITLPSCWHKLNVQLGKVWLNACNSKKLSTTTATMYQYDVREPSHRRATIQKW